MTRKCEGCGLVGDEAAFVHIHLLNGGLCLCRPCLAELNGKNPELAALRERVAALEAELARERSGVVVGRFYACGCPALRSDTIRAFCDTHYRPLDQPPGRR